ncbi:MAG: peptidoglycan-binding protein [Acidobacteriia bacterium]|nr:peptidoglycan-binding protein [Terriglobia bacterium]
MRSIAIVIALAFSTAFAVWAATPAPKGKSSAKKTTARKSTAKSAKSAAKKVASGKQPASAKEASSKKTSGKRTSAKQTATSFRRSTQREPAPERYKEIQQSLADKGYFAGPVNGTWNSDSVEALKRFQRDQNIGDDGKLGSLSLIALGLGPKRGAEKSENSETSPTPP